MQTHNQAIHYSHMKYILGIMTLIIAGTIVFTMTNKDIQKEMIPAQNTPTNTQNTNTNSVQNSGSVIVPSPTGAQGSGSVNTKPQVIQGSNGSASPVAPTVPRTQPTKPRLTMAEVSMHNSAASCYSVVSDKVYDLTTWIGKHPGGAEAIKRICGVDGTAGFSGKHGGQSQPESTLTQYFIGNLEN